MFKFIAIQSKKALESVSDKLCSLSGFKKNVNDIEQFILDYSMHDCIDYNKNISKRKRISSYLNITLF